MRTYDRSTFMAARAAWEQGDYGWQWQAIRRIAAERGFIYPPSGTAHDDREAEKPSQRAVVWRALQDNPGRLEAIVRRARSWNEVVERVIGLEASLRTDADYAERDEQWDRRDNADHRESVRTLGQILQRIEDSR